MRGLRVQHWVTSVMVSLSLRSRLYQKGQPSLNFATGNYNTVIVCPESQRETGEEIITWGQKRAVELDGTVTGEHGIGLKIRDRLVDEVGEEAVDMMRSVSVVCLVCLGKITYPY